MTDARSAGDPRTRDTAQCALERLAERIGPEAVKRIAARLEDACAGPGEAWVYVEIRCKGRVHHVDVSIRERIGSRPLTQSLADDRGIKNGGGP